jgi:hypothetical protein
MTSHFAIIGNRQWSIALGTLVVAALLFAFGRGSLSERGSQITYTITVVPSDAHNLNCALGGSINGQQCGFDEGKSPRTVAEPLRPYVTTHRELLLLKGVFESADVAHWLSAARTRNDDSRVTLECQVSTLGVVPKVFVRWSDDGAFQPEENVMAGTVNRCTLQP